MIKPFFFNLLFSFCFSIACLAQFPQKDIYILNNNLLGTDQIAVSAILKKDSITLENRDGYANRETIEMKDYLVFSHVNNVYFHNIFILSVKKSKKSMHLIFTFKQYDETPPHKIFLDDISFREGTYFFNFVDNEITQSTLPVHFDNKGAFHIKMSQCKKFRLTRKIISATDLQKSADHEKNKKAKAIHKILSVFKEK